MRRNTLAILFTLTLMILVASLAPESHSYAAGKTGVSSAVVTINGSKSSTDCTTFVQGLSGTTKIQITMSLQKNNKGAWSNVCTWSGTRSGASYVLGKSKAVSSGTYRVKSVIKVTGKAGTTSLTRYSTTANR